VFALKSAFGTYVEITKTGKVVATHREIRECTMLSMHISDAHFSFKRCRNYLTIDEVPIYTFYGYRAAETDDTPTTNVNVGNLAGVLWYLHNEVVVRQPRKFDITRIVRILLRITPPDKLRSTGMNFGVRFAYDAGNCTGAGKVEWQGEGSCDPFYEKYGYFVVATT